MTRTQITPEALRAAVAMASAEVFDVDVPMGELLDDVPVEDVAQALAVMLSVVLDVLARAHVLQGLGAVAARAEGAGQ